MSTRRWVRSRKTKPRVSVSGAHCRVRGGRVDCSFRESSRARSTLSPGCYVDLSTRRWVCPEIPRLHGRKATKINRLNQDEQTGQTWLDMGDDHIQVTAFPVSVGQRRETSMARTKPPTKSIDPCLRACRGRRGMDFTACVQDCRSRSVRGTAATRGQPPRFGLTSPVRAANQNGAFISQPRRPGPVMVPTSPVRPQPQCCVYEQDGSLFLHCDPDQMDWSGSPLEGQCHELDDGTVQCSVIRYDADGNATTIVLPACQPDDEPREADCCYDQETQTLECEGQSIPVTVTTTFTYPDGRMGVSVASDQLPGGGTRVPICPPPEEEPEIPDCCFDESTGTLLCPGQPWNHLPVQVVTAFTFPDGRSGVSVVADQLPGGGIRVPLCPPVDCPECPPGTYLDTRTGECIRCPDIPQCPPGTYLDTRTGECVRCPDIPECPPGLLFDPSTGECVRCPDIPECPPGLLFDPQTRQCVRCPEDCPDCPPGMGFDPETGQCRRFIPQCPPGYLIDPSNGDCVRCPPPQTRCPPGLEYDPRTGQCIKCPPPCPPGWFRDPVSLECCPPPKPFRFPNRRR